jgi:hypothetical protein
LPALALADDVRFGEALFKAEGLTPKKIEAAVKKVRGCLLWQQLDGCWGLRLLGTRAEITTFPCMYLKYISAMLWHWHGTAVLLLADNSYITTADLQRQQTWSTKTLRASAKHCNIIRLQSEVVALTKCASSLLSAVVCGSNKVVD